MTEVEKKINETLNKPGINSHDELVQAILQLIQEEREVTESGTNGCKCVYHSSSSDIEATYHKGFYEGTIAGGAKYKDKLPK